jgi:hypothetical protein
MIYIYIYISIYRYNEDKGKGKGHHFYSTGGKGGWLNKTIPLVHAVIHGNEDEFRRAIDLAIEYAEHQTMKPLFIKFAAKQADPAA